ncbi:MAG TPA: leucine-rich repeat protein [Candidatus Limiplasma sp.]|nr:leucine-rich repeat protein [Candidatus Limiplasma sp.]
MEIEGVVYCSHCARKLETDGECPFCGYQPANAKAMPETLEESTLLSGRYLLGCAIGIGGFGVTYAAWDYVLGAPVAVKEYFPRGVAIRNSAETDRVGCSEANRALYQIGLRRFVREARILASLQSVRGIVAVHDFFEDNGTAYIVMEFLHGVTLGEYAAARTLKPAELFAMLREPMETLAAVHKQGVLHRDISPSNLLVLEDGSVKLIDFGAATFLEPQTDGTGHTVVLSESFASPEQYLANGEQGPWTDVYSLCATLCCLLMGDLPDARARQAGAPLPPIRAKGSRLPRRQRRVLLSGLAMEPRKRIQSMDEFRCRLFNLPLPEEARRRRRLILRMGIALSAALLMLTLMFINQFVGFPMGEGLWYSLSAGGFRVARYTGQTDQLQIPARRLGLAVTAVGDSAFEHNAGLESVTLPPTVRDIGKLAFHDCGRLWRVTLAQGAQTVQEYAFSECAALRTVTVPDSVTAIAENAFAGDDAALTLRGERGSAVEAYADQLRLTFLCDAEYACAPNGTGLTLTACTAAMDQVVLPDELNGTPVTAIAGNRAQSGNGWMPETLTSIVLPAQMEILPQGALTGYAQLDSVTLGAGTKALDTQALAGTAIRDINLPQGLTYIGDEAFRATYLQQISLPATVEVIGAKAFAESQIDRVDLPASLTFLGEKAFANCLSLASASLSAGIATVPAGAFQNCETLTDVQLPLGIAEIGYQAFADCDSLRSLTLPDSLTAIDGYAFANCVSLRVIDVPLGVKSIADSAFSGCPTDLCMVVDANSYAEAFARRMGYAYQLRENQYGAWTAYENAGGYGLVANAGADAVDTAILPSLYRAKPINIIYDATQLAAGRVELPKLLEEISTQAFQGNRTLQTLVMREGLRSIDSQAFQNCAGLTEAQFPFGLESIGIGAFENCSSLREARLPETLTRLDAAAFYGCTGLTEIHIPSSLCLLPIACFGNTGVKTVTVPGTVSKCIAPFFRCNQLESAVLKDGVRTVWCAFSGCGNLRTVVFPASVRQISRATFNGCAKLTDVWFYTTDVDLDFELASFSVKLSEEVVAVEGDGVEVASLFASCPKVTLHGYAGSVVETYAQTNGLRFMPIPV